MKTRRKSESGFALLLVFAMAAAVSLLLYMEMPRVAFESQRLREEMLLDRGSEYKRAIKYYVRDNKKFPASLDDLEKSGNNKRYLRHRYNDPMTGKDDWRIIHVGPNGEFTDSITQKRTGPNDSDKKTNTNTFITEMPAIGSTGQEGGGAVTVANRVRESDKRPMIPGQEVPGNPQDPNVAYYKSNSITEQPTLTFSPNAQPDPTNPNQWQPANPHPVESAPGAQPRPGQQQPPIGFPIAQPGQQPPIGFPVAQPGQQPPIGFPIAQPGQQPPIGFPIAQPGVSTNPSDPVNRLIRGASQGQLPPQPSGVANSQNSFGGSLGGVAGSGFGNGATNPAIAAINSALRNPTPGGLTNAGLSTTGLGQGIAGVASKFEAEGIKIYDERSKYNEWEFLYDPRKEMANPGNGKLDPSESDRNKSYFDPRNPQPVKPVQPGQPPRQ